MESKSRTEYSVMNTTVAFAAQAAAILMGFFTRVIFTRTLSEGYVGINGLFTDILNILSLSELGVGTAITYALYGPIAKKDIEKQQILMRMFRTFYRMTAAFVLTAGLCLIPFLNVLMKDRPDVDHLVLIYLLYLLNSVVSYLLIYKKTLVDAHQMNYITVLNHNGFLVLQDICQILVLLTTGNFVLFLIVAVVCTISGNICMSKKADALFPYLKEPCTKKLPKEERQDILKNVKAMLMHKLGNVIVNNTDNLLISSFVGVVTAGIYSNYYLVIGSIRQVLEQALLGVAQPYLFGGFSEKLISSAAYALDALKQSEDDVICRITDSDGNSDAVFLINENGSGYCFVAVSDDIIAQVGLFSFTPCDTGKELYRRVWEEINKYDTIVAQ